MEPVSSTENADERTNAVACSVIISTRNRARLIVETVESILPGVVAPSEIVVVDQSAEENDELAELVRHHSQLKVVRSSTRGLSAGRNAGVAAAQHGVLVFTDDDVLAEPGWLRELTDQLTQADGRTVVTGRVVAGPPERPGAQTDSVSSPTKPRINRGVLTTDPLAGNNFSLLRDAFEEIGAFDERLGPGARYRSADDNDFGRRLLSAGYTILYVHEAVLVHRAWRAGDQLTRLQWDYGVGQGAFLGKHLSLVDGWAFRRLIGGGRDHNPLRRGGSRDDLAYILGLATGATSWVVRERLVGSRRKTDKKAASDTA
jgi:GT2 family glycosyltransferase